MTRQFGLVEGYWFHEETDCKDPKCDRKVKRNQDCFYDDDGGVYCSNCGKCERYARKKQEQREQHEFSLGIRR